jgi:hypothetical protein
MQRCYGMSHKKEFNRHFFHAIQKSDSHKWLRSPDERIDFYQAEALHDSVNTLFIAGPVRTRFMMAFRHPMDRIISFFRTSLLEDGESSRFYNTTFFEYLDSPDIVSQDNVMVRQIVDKRWPTTLVHGDLLKAIDFVEQKAFLLDAEDRTASLLHLEAFLGLSHHGEDQARDACAQKMIHSEFHEATDPHLHKFQMVQDKINEHVRFDTALYKRMQELFEEQGYMLGISMDSYET